MNKLETEVVQTPIRKQEECAKFIIEDTYVPFVFNDVFKEIDVSYVFSFWVKSEHNGMLSVSGQKYQTTQTWKKYVIDINPYEKNLRLFFDESGIYYMYNSQLEKGDYGTDWRPAVEDVDQSISDTRTYFDITSEAIRGEVVAAEARMSSLIEQTAGGIRSEVSGIDGKITAIEQTASGITARLNGVESTANNASKTATNYLNFSDKGLIIGDHTAGTLGRNILVGSEYIDIRSGENTLARYADKNIHLGMDSTDSAIYLCGDVGKMSVTNGGWLQLETTGVLSLYSGSQTHIETKYVSGNPSSLISESRISTYATDSSASVMISSTTRNNLLGDTYIHVLPTEIELRAYSGAYAKTIGLELDATLSEVRISDGRLYVANGQGVFDRGVTIYNGATISGSVIMSNGLSVSGSASIGSALSVGGTISEGGTALSSKYYSSGSHMHASSLTIGTSDPLIYCDDGQHLRFRWLSGGAYRYMAMEDLYNLGWGYTSSSGINSNASTFNINTAANRNGVTVSGNFRPKVDNDMSCGTTSYRWTKVWAFTGSIQTSDEREKDILTDVDLKNYSDLFMDIKPIAYRWKNSQDKQIYFGVGAQTLEQQFKEHGYDPSLYGIIEYNELEEPTLTGQTDRYGMNYQNLQMLTLMQTQKNTRELETLRTENAELKATNTNLQARVEALWDIVMQMYHEFYVLKNK